MQARSVDGGVLSEDEQSGVRGRVLASTNKTNVR
jgi:hypothetical protein